MNSTVVIADDSVDSWKRGRTDPDKDPTETSSTREVSTAVLVVDSNTETAGEADVRYTVLKDEPQMLAEKEELLCSNPDGSVARTFDHSQSPMEFLSDDFIKEAEAELRRLNRLDSRLSRHLEVQITVEAMVSIRRAEIEDDLRAMQQKRIQLACEFLQRQSCTNTILLLAAGLGRPALGIACCFLRTNGWELSSEELDCVLRVFKGHIHQVAETLPETDGTFETTTFSCGEYITSPCGYRNTLIFEMLKIWAEDVQRISKLQFEELGDNGFSISVMIEAVLATKLPRVLLTEKDLNNVSAMFVTDEHCLSQVCKGVLSATRESAAATSNLDTFDAGDFNAPRSADSVPAACSSSGSDSNSDKPTSAAEVPQLLQEEPQRVTLNNAMTGEGTEAGYCLPPALVDQWQCEDVPGGGSCSVSFCRGSLDCDDDGMCNSQVYDDDEQPGIMCFSDLLKTHAIDLVHQEDSRDSQISHAERRCVSAEMDTSRSKALSDQSSDAEKDKKVPVPLAGESVPCYPAGGEAGSKAAQVPEGNLTDALAITLKGSDCCSSAKAEADYGFVESRANTLDTDRELTGDNHSEDAASEVTTEPAIGISRLTLSELVRTRASNQRLARPKARILNQLVAVSRAWPQVKTESALTRPKYWMPFAYSSLIDNCPMLRLYPTQLLENKVFDTDDPLAYFAFGC